MRLALSINDLSRLPATKIPASLTGDTAWSAMPNDWFGCRNRQNDSIDAT